MMWCLKGTSNSCASSVRARMFVCVGHCRRFSSPFSSHILLLPFVCEIFCDLVFMGILLMRAHIQTKGKTIKRAWCGRNLICDRRVPCHSITIHLQHCWKAAPYAICQRLVSILRDTMLHRAQIRIEQYFGVVERKTDWIKIMTGKKRSHDISDVDPTYTQRVSMTKI